MNVAGQLELHAVEGLRESFASGMSPNDLFQGEPLFYQLTSEYTRSPRFKECVRVFIENGLKGIDEALLAVLANDADGLQSQIDRDPSLIARRFTLRCAYTPLLDASLLHVCAEFNHVDCAEVLVKRHVDVNARAGVDENGFGGQTPIFHTVNQNGNQSEEMMDFLLSRGADLSVTVKGLVWGKGYDWETFIPSVNPISYAMMGLLPQMHRNEIVIHNTVKKLIKWSYGIDFPIHNVPNVYLKS